MARVIRLPADAKQSTALMDMQEQVLTAVNQQNANLITIIANVLKPVAVGLLYIYGIQGVASTINKAKEKAKHGFLWLCRINAGNFFSGIRDAMCKCRRNRMVEGKDVQYGLPHRSPRYSQSK